MTTNQTNLAKAGFDTARGSLVKNAIVITGDE